MSSEALTTFDIIFRITLGAVFLTMLLYVLFGQITVRKLRKNPKTKDELGLELASGWDILNVASTLAMPRWFNRKLKNSPLNHLHANADTLDKYTTIFDKILAIIFYGFYVCTGLSLILLLIFDTFISG